MPGESERDPQASHKAVADRFFIPWSPLPVFQLSFLMTPNRLSSLDGDRRHPSISLDLQIFPDYTEIYWPLSSGKKFHCLHLENWQGKIVSITKLWENDLQRWLWRRNLMKTINHKLLTILFHHTVAHKKYCEVNNAFFIFIFKMNCADNHCECKIWSYPPSFFPTFLLYVFRRNFMKIDNLCVS